MNETTKYLLIVGSLGILAWITILFIVFTGAMLTVWSFICLGLYGLYKLWGKYAKQGFLKNSRYFGNLSNNKKTTE